MKDPVWDGASEYAALIASNEALASIQFRVNEASSERREIYYQREKHLTRHLTMPVMRVNV